MSDDQGLPGDGIAKLASDPADLDSDIAPTRVAPVAGTLLEELTKLHAATSARRTETNARVAKAKAASEAKARALTEAANDGGVDVDVDVDIGVDAAADPSELSALAEAATHVVPPRRPLARPPSAQSGRTIPLSSALLTEAFASVGLTRAAPPQELAAAAPDDAAPVASVAVVAADAAVTDAPRRSTASLGAVALVFALGFSLFVAGVVMFLEAQP